MKKNREVIEMVPEVKVSLNILPFGRMRFETGSVESPIEEKVSEIPQYIEPLTTNVEKVEIRYGEDGIYSVPKTTAGI